MATSSTFSRSTSLARCRGGSGPVFHVRCDHGGLPHLLTDIGRISDKIGARKPIIAVATLLIAVGIAAPWILKSVMGMYGFALLAGLGYGIYSSVDQALNVDVLPSKEEAGKDLAS